MHVQRRSGALLLVVAVLQLTARASAVTKSVLVGPDNTLTFRDMESGDSTTTVTAGDTVRWQWVSGTHSTTRLDAPETWDSGVQSTPFSFSRQFMVPGTFPYICTVHVSFGMTGTVVVQPAGASTTTSTLTPTTTTTTTTTTLPPALRCEDTAMRKLAGLSGPIVKCHARAARRGFKQEPFDEEACEARAKAQFDRAARKLPAATCPACLLGARAALRDQVESLLDTATGAAFCAAGAPFGGDDAGSAPADQPSLKCGIKVTRNAASLVEALVACRIQAADSAFRMAPFDAEACAGAAETRFVMAVGRIKRCPACLDSALLRDAVKAAVDRLAADAYCAQ